MQEASGRAAAGASVLRRPNVPATTPHTPHPTSHVPRPTSLVAAPIRTACFCCSQPHLAGITLDQLERRTTMGMKTPPPWVRSPCVALGQDAVYGEAQLEGVAQEQRDPCPSPADEVSCGGNAPVSHRYSHATCSTNTVLQKWMGLMILIFWIELINFQNTKYKSVCVHSCVRAGGVFCACMYVCLCVAVHGGTFL